MEDDPKCAVIPRVSAVKSDASPRSTTTTTPPATNTTAKGEWLTGRSGSCRQIGSEARTRKTLQTPGSERRQTALRGPSQTLGRIKRGDPRRHGQRISIMPASRRARRSQKQKRRHSRQKGGIFPLVDLIPILAAAGKAAATGAVSAAAGHGLK